MQCQTNPILVKDPHFLICMYGWCPFFLVVKKSKMHKKKQKKVSHFIFLWLPCISLFPSPLSFSSLFFPCFVLASLTSRNRIRSFIVKFRKTTFFFFLFSVPFSFLLNMNWTMFPLFFHLEMLSCTCVP